VWYLKNGTNPRNRLYSFKLAIYGSAVTLLISDDQPTLHWSDASSCKMSQTGSSKGLKCGEVILQRKRRLWAVTPGWGTSSADLSSTIVVQAADNWLNTLWFLCISTFSTTLLDVLDKVRFVDVHFCICIKENLLTLNINI